MPYKRLSTGKIARQVGCHPNTVRFYEQQGFLPAVRRNPRNNYRLYSEAHIDHMQLALLAFKAPFPGRPLRRSLTNLVKHAAVGDLGGALGLAFNHQTLVRSEIAQANSAADFLEKWVGGMTINGSPRSLWTGETALLLGVTIDSLRTWERNGLIDVPRNPQNGYRHYGAQEIGRLRVIRMLRSAGYSISAILRMFTYLERGEDTDLRKALDTPDPDDDIFFAADAWLSTLAEHENIAQQLIDMLQEIIRKQQENPKYYTD